MDGPMVRTAVLTCLAIVLASLASCSGAGDPPCPDQTERFVRYELLMGRSGPDGEVVDDAAWETFLADTVTPRFPDGLSVLDGRGQWRDSAGLVQRERSKLLLILAPPGDGPADLIGEISDGYKRRFGQESVLRVVSEACVSFD